MINIVFFGAKDFEKDFFNDHLQNNFNIMYEDYPLLPDTKLSESVKDAEIISVFTSSRLSEETLKQFENLKLVAARSVGYSHIDTEYCKAKGIKVVNTPHYGDYTVAEFSFALLLALARKVSQAQNDLRNGNSFNEYNGIELYNKTIGIIGTGGIGSKAAKIASGFNMNILAYDLYPNETLAQECGVKYVDLDTLIKESDVICLYAPATKENYHLLNEDKFALMKNGVVIINSARGELIDTQALYDALISGKVAAAGLDVLECEEAIMRGCDTKSNSCDDVDCLKKTLVNHRLLALHNVIVTPHVAYDTKEAIHRILDMTVNNIVAYSENKKIKNIVV